jgi:hypothetical protein
MTTDQPRRRIIQSSTKQRKHVLRRTHTSGGLVSCTPSPTQGYRYGENDTIDGSCSCTDGRLGFITGPVYGELRQQDSVAFTAEKVHGATPTRNTTADCRWTGHSWGRTAVGYSRRRVQLTIGRSTNSYESACGPFALGVTAPGRTHASLAECRKEVHLEATHHDCRECRGGAYDGRIPSVESATPIAIGSGGRARSRGRVTPARSTESHKHPRARTYAGGYNHQPDHRAGVPRVGG